MVLIRQLISNCRSSRRALLLLIYGALFLDNMLLTTVVPIMPDYLYRLDRSAARKLNVTSFLHNGRNASSTRHEVIKKENIRIGILFGSKAIVQMITNPFVSHVINKIGYTVPMFIGFCVMFVSTVVFTFGISYGTLFFARMLQGFGSAFTSTAGMGILALVYPDDQERGSAMGFALGGLALGVLVGPPFGGLLYKYAGKGLPFFLLAMLALIEGALQFVILQPKISRDVHATSSFRTLLTDPYILLASGAITIGNLGIAIMEPTLPLWMMDTMHANSAQIGATFLPASISYLLGTNIFGPLAYKFGRWLSTLVGLITIGGCLIAIPQSSNPYQLIVPMGFMGFAIGMIDASMFPQMGLIVDKRHVGAYGGVYAIADAAFCMAFAFGPIVGGPIISAISFPSMLFLAAAVNFLYSPLLITLRNVKEQESGQSASLFEEKNVLQKYQPFEDTPLTNDSISMQSYGY